MSSFLMHLALAVGMAALVRLAWSWASDAWREPSVRRVLSLAALLVSSVAVGWIAFWMLLPCGLRTCELDAAVRWTMHRTVIVDRHGGDLGVLEPSRGVWVPLADYPPEVLAAVTSAEDHRYWNHAGADWIGAGRALLRRIVLGSREGASTIAMQAAQLVVGDHGSGILPPDGTFKGKIAETSIAYRLIETRGHRGTLELYLNEVPLGPIRGLEAASQHLFGLSARELDLGRAAVLAAMIRAPSAISPRRNPGLARRERDRVLRLVARNHPSLRNDAEWARSQPIALAPVARTEGSDFLRALRAEARRGGSAVGRGDVVHTTFDPDLDLEGRAQLLRVISQVERGLFGSHRPQGGRLQGMFVALGLDGSVRAYVAGRPDEVPLAWDRIADGRIRLASTMKPILLAAAIEHKLVRLGDRVSALEAAASPDLNDPWVRSIRSSSNRNRTVAEALARSDNWLAVLLWEILPASAFARLERNGVLAVSPSHPVESMGVGTVRPLDLAATYAAFANGGVRPVPHLIIGPEAPMAQRVWSERTARLVSRALEDVVVMGTAWNASGLSSEGAPLAGKTGTVDGNTELVMVGFRRSRDDAVVSLMWLGFDLPEPIASGAEAGRVLARAWAEVTVMTGQANPPAPSILREIAGRQNP